MNRSAILAAALAASLSPLPLAAQQAGPAPGQPLSGFYLGFHGGYGWSNVDSTVSPYGLAAVRDLAPRSLSTNLSAPLIGAQAGYNYQINRWLLGVEADFSQARLTGTSQATFPSILVPNNGTNGIMTTNRIDWLASLRARVGYTMGPGQAYFTGGMAWESLTQRTMVQANVAPGIWGVTGTNSGSSTRFGFVLGAGYEWAVAPNWTARGEYLYYNFGSSNTLGVPFQSCSTGTTTACGTTSSANSNNVSVLRVALSYKFGGPSMEAPAAPAATPVGSLTGFYMGFHGGYGWSSADTSITPSGNFAVRDFPRQTATVTSSGAVFGAQIGYNWQAGNWVLGAEGDFSGAGLSGTADRTFPSLLANPAANALNGFTTADRIDWLASIRARAGYIVGPGQLYATIGPAWEGVTRRTMVNTNVGPAVFGVTGTTSNSGTRFGLAAGVGYEWSLSRNVTLRGEYLLYSFNGSDNASAALRPCGTAPCSANISSGSNIVNVFRVAANYRF